MSNNEEYFDSIITGLNQAIDYTKGDTSKGKKVKIIIAPLHQYDAKKIKSIREKQHLSQSVFASALGVSKKTVEAWESGHNHPRGPVRRILELMESEENFLKNHNILTSS